MGRFAISAFGHDRPGIVAAVTGALFDLGANLEDCAMARLSGYFTMMLLVDAGPAAAREVDGALQRVAAPLDLRVSVAAVTADGAEAEVGEAWMVSVYGADRPGIVHWVTALLAERAVNVTDLATRLVGPPDQLVYVMLIEAVVPPGVDTDRLRVDLQELARELGVDASLHPVDADVL